MSKTPSLEEQALAVRTLVLDHFVIIRLADAFDERRCHAARVALHTVAERSGIVIRMVQYLDKLYVVRVA